MTEAAWGYVRLSQTGRDESLDEQKRAIREYARENSLDLQTTRNDGEQTSGFDHERDEYQLVREKIRNDEIDAVIVRDRARLSRDFDERLRLLLDFRRTDVDWHVIEAGGFIDVSNLQTAGMECLHAMMDHMKKQHEIERARAAVEERLDAGYDHGRPPFGMTYDDAGQYLVPGEDFETVREILRRSESGESPGSIGDATGVSSDTVRRVIGREEWYLARAAETMEASD